MYIKKKKLKKWELIVPLRVLRVICNKSSLDYMDSDQWKPKKEKNNNKNWNWNWISIIWIQISENQKKNNNNNNNKLRSSL